MPFGHDDDAFAIGVFRVCWWFDKNKLKIKTTTKNGKRVAHTCSIKQYQQWISMTKISFHSVLFMYKALFLMGNFHSKFMSFIQMCHRIYLWIDQRLKLSITKMDKEKWRGEVWIGVAPKCT